MIQKYRYCYGAFLVQLQRRISATYYIPPANHLGFREFTTGDLNSESEGIS